jgi:multidrug resistance efflux pump
MIERMRDKQLLTAVALVAVAIAGGALFALHQRTKPAAPADTKAAAPPPEVVLPAKISAQTVVPVGVPISGIVESLLVETGQQVAEGQLLGRIKNTALGADSQSAAADLDRLEAAAGALENQVIVARAEAASARADAAHVRAEFDRSERAYLRQQMLAKEGATPRLVYEKSAREYEAAKTERDRVDEFARGADDRLSLLVRNLDVARRSVEEATQTLDHARLAAAAGEILSPATGIVARRTRQVGDEVTPDVQDLFQIAVDLAALEAVIQPDAVALSRMRAGQEAVISVAGVSDAIVTRITEIRGNEVMIRFVSPSPAVRPGSTAQVRIKLS